MTVDAFPAAEPVHYIGDGCEPIVHARLDAEARAKADREKRSSALPPVRTSPIAFVFPSSTDGYPHVVTRSDLDVVPEGGEPYPRLSCTCKGAVNPDRNPDGCWAEKWVRVLLASIVIA